MTTKSKVEITIATLKDRYWLKSELIKFCRENALSSTGSKEEIMHRIDLFLVTGSRIKITFCKPGSRDSYEQINVNTLVENYKNDALTRSFFVSQVGEGFRFNSYLRQFTKKENITPGLTYGNLVAGWLAAEEEKKAGHQTNIDEQFEYNRFVRDFYLHEVGKSHAEMIAAWKITKQLTGERSYAHYRRLLDAKKKR